MGLLARIHVEHAAGGWRVAAAGQVLHHSGSPAGRPIPGTFLGARVTALIGLYVLGFLAAVVTARLLKSSVLKKRAHTLSDGDATLSLADGPWLGAAADRSVECVFTQSRHCNPRGGCSALGSRAVAADGRQAADDRGQLDGEDRPCGGAGDPAA